jgi:hypothetical protein
LFSASTPATAAPVTPLEETRLFQALNIVRVLQRFLAGRPNAEYLLLLLARCQRGTNHRRPAHHLFHPTV